MTSPLRLTFVMAAIVLMTSLHAADAGAVLVANYGFGPSAALGTPASSDMELNSAASNFVEGPGFTPGVETGYSSGGNPVTSIGVVHAGLTMTEAGAVAADDYWSFSVTPNAGFALNLSSLSFQVNSGEQVAYRLRSSVDGFSTTLGGLTFSPQPSFPQSDTSLTSAPFQGLTSPIEFRIYVYTPLTQTADSRIDNVLLDGTVVAVPEAGSALLVGAAGLAALAIRRRGHRG